MFELDHVAIVVKDVPAGVKFYQEMFGAVVLYADETWAFLRLGQGKLALGRAEQHPPHVALRGDMGRVEKAAAKAGKKIDAHRDGTAGIYVDDPNGNVVELIHYPAGNAYES